MKATKHSNGEVKTIDLKAAKTKKPSMGGTQVKVVARKPAVKNVAVAKKANAKKAKAIKNPVQVTREQWLRRIVAMARPMFEKAGSPLPAPEKLRVAIGLPSGSRKARGQCFRSVCAADGGRELWVSPTIGGAGDEIKFISTMVHELCHAALEDEVGHTAPFVRLGTAMFLEGKPTHMIGENSEAFTKVWEPIIKKVGPYPGVAFNPGSAEKTQKTHLVKVACNDGECGAVFRITAKWIDAAEGGLTCPVCKSDDLGVG